MNIKQPNDPHRLYLLRPNQKLMVACRVALIAEWLLVATPNAILSFGATTANLKFAHAFSISQRIEPVVYTCVSLMLASLYTYYAYSMFKKYTDIKVRLLLARLLYANLFLVALAAGNIIALNVGGAIVQSSYLAFFFSFVCYDCRIMPSTHLLTYFKQLKVELWMLSEIGLLTTESLDR
jgi:hypothetical protein